MSAAIAIDNTKSEITNVLTNVMSLSEKGTIAATASKRSYLAELDNAEAIGAKRGKAMARKALLAGIPSDVNEFHEWANR